MTRTTVGLSKVRSARTRPARTRVTRLEGVAPQRSWSLRQRRFPPRSLGPVVDATQPIGGILDARHGAYQGYGVE
jgi:hypothetical protein